MKTTVEISDSLLQETRKLAATEGTTVRALVEEGLRAVLGRRRSRRFKLRKVTFGGQGLNPDSQSWDQVRALAYEGRGS